MYANGEGVPQDYAAAAKWFRLAAEQGHALSQYNLGLMYDKGEGYEVSSDRRTRSEFAWSYATLWQSPASNEEIHICWLRRW